jgi:hypothetical protein
MLFRLSLTILIATRFIAGVHAEEMDEYQVKAAFLYNFTKFVDWPVEAFRTPEEPFGICILGDDPFGKALDLVVAGRSIAGRPLIVHRISGARQIEGCHVLFVSSSAIKRGSPVLAATQRPGVLTVGEADNPAADSLIIDFTLKGSKVRFEINLSAAEHQRLHLSSKLLSLASAVRRK